MAEDGKTALLSPIYDIEALANNISKLIEDNCLRKRIAYDGNNYIQNFSWENSYTQMKNLITKQ